VFLFLSRSNCKIKTFLCFTFNIFSKRDFVKILLFRSIFEIARVVLSALRKIIVVAQHHSDHPPTHPLPLTTSPWRKPQRRFSATSGCAPRRCSGAASENLFAVVVVVGRHLYRSRWSVVGGVLVVSCRAVFFVVVDRKFWLSTRYPGDWSEKLRVERGRRCITPAS